MFRSFGWCLIPALSGVVAVVACGGDIETKYGPPGGLLGATFPSGSATGTGTGTGTTPPSDAGGDAVVAACSVSFKTDIYPMMTTGNWKCANSNCHGTQGGTSPFIDPASATAAYTSLKAYVINGKAYINPTSTDPAQSSFDCNLKGACGAGQMPVPGGAVGAIAATQAEIAKVDTWLTCGSPNN